MTIAILSVGLIFCSISTIFLTYLVVQTQIELKAMQKSTHQVQFVPANDFEKISKETKEALEKEFFDNIQ